MKALASLVMISAILAGTAACAHEPSGELDYPPPIGAASPLARDKVRAEAAAAHANGSYTFDELEYRASFSLTHASRSCGSYLRRHGDPPCFLFPQQEPFSPF